MKKTNVKALKNGLYKIYWKSGGYSYASSGLNKAGERWLAPVNWVTISENTPRSVWKEVSHAEPMIPFGDIYNKINTDPS